MAARENRPRSHPRRGSRRVNTTVPLPTATPEVAARFEKIRQRPVVLEVDHLHKSFGEGGRAHVAIGDLSFQVHRREFVCVLGQSGCGKSTLIRILAGLDFPTRGAVTLDGVRVSGPGPERGMVFQGYTLFPWLTVKQNVMFGLKVGGKSNMSAESEAREWIALIGLGKFEDTYPHQLSGGMKQRVAIARALANRPRVLFMDEPFGALDAQTRAQMQGYLLQIWKQVDVTIVFITHDLDEATYLSDRILVLGANPGHLISHIDNPVPRPRDPAQFQGETFQGVRRHLDSLIHPPETLRTDKLPLPRMTVVGDEVI